MTLRSSQIPRHAAALLGGEEPRTVTDTAERKTAKGVIAIPKAADFEGAEFLEDEELSRIAGDLIETYPKRFGLLEHLQFKCGWKVKGGNAGGKPAYGGAIKTSGINRQYIGADFLFWIAAEESRVRHGEVMGHSQAEALLFHQLCHAGWNPKQGTPVIRPHDFEGFLIEVEKIGAWNSDLQEAARTFRQMRMPES